MESELSLIVIVGVEVSEVCIGIRFSGKLWVEVLVSFLQDQIVFVEGLWIERRKVKVSFFFSCNTWIKSLFVLHGKVKASPSEPKQNGKRKATQNNERIIFYNTRSTHLQTGWRNDKPALG